jgi:hypothetical protein
VPDSGRRDRARRPAVNRPVLTGSWGRNSAADKTGNFNALRASDGRRRQRACGLSVMGDLMDDRKDDNPHDAKEYDHDETTCEPAATSAFSGWPPGSAWKGDRVACCPGTHVWRRWLVGLRVGRAARKRHLHPSDALGRAYLCRVITAPCRPIPCESRSRSCRSHPDCGTGSSRGSRAPLEAALSVRPAPAQTSVPQTCSSTPAHPS